MKKIYIVPATNVAPFNIEAILHNISNNTISGGSNNGGSTSDGGDTSFGTGEGSVGTGDFAKDRGGFYSGFYD